jgi:PilZ domain
MNSKLDRPPRTNLVSHGFIYLGEEEHKITINNISINGVLVQLNTEREDIDIKYIFNQLLVSTIIDLYLPEMRLAGEAEVVRADMEEGHILLALEFKNIAYDVDKDLNKRKAYRKNMTGLGRILLNGEYRNFTTVNVSVEGLMIYLSETIPVEVGTITHFEFNRLELEGKIKVIWVDPVSDGRTLIGLQYVHMENTAIKGIPRFAL